MCGKMHKRQSFSPQEDMEKVVPQRDRREARGGGERERIRSTHRRGKHQRRHEDREQQDS